REVERSRSFPIRGLVKKYSVLACFGLLVIGAANWPASSPARSAAGSNVSAQGVTNYTGITVESSQQIFATMCALDAAGFDADESTLAEMPSRLRLRADLLKQQGPATDALRQFYRDHALANSGETLSRYITFALVAGPPPQFQFLYDHDLLPPEVLSIESFQDLLVNFYREAHLATRWAAVEPEYERAQSVYDSPVRRIVTVTNGYLREVLKASHGRTFTVNVEPLVGKRTNFRNFGDNYSIVVGTTSPLPIVDIQHAYLHFMLDSLPLRYRKEVEAKSALLNIAARAPRLPVDYQDDFLNFTDECVIKAVELRLQRPSPEKLESVLKEDDQSGFILVRPLVQQLQIFEKGGPAMSYYFPELIAGIDVAAEQKRLQSVTFAAADAKPVQKHQAASASEDDFDEGRLLAEGDRAIALKDVEGAKKAFGQVLAKDPNQPRALYGVAIASILAGDADDAKQDFEKVVTQASKGGLITSADAVDPGLLAWAHIYLGRIFDVEDDRESAIKEYRAALAVVGAPETARVAAQRGVESAYQPAAPPGGTPQ
ncbi:MAG TPA: tetratricopeptide repeat protein, partial [Candidatus Acidoferrales bacterium]|nr:tetratricopeptide repeat protein [Candidatus Acidoferrales bacterium]